LIVTSQLYNMYSLKHIVVWLLVIVVISRRSHAMRGKFSRVGSTCSCQWSGVVGLKIVMFCTIMHTNMESINVYHFCHEMLTVGTGILIDISYIGGSHYNNTFLTHVSYGIYILYVLWFQWIWTLHNLNTFNLILIILFPCIFQYPLTNFTLIKKGWLNQIAFENFERLKKDIDREMIINLPNYS
jgi:hypothetical protein